MLRDGDYHLQYILITHKHPDHCDATSAVANAFPEAQIVMHELDVQAIGPLADIALMLQRRRNGAVRRDLDDPHAAHARTHRRVVVLSL